MITLDFTMEHFPNYFANQAKEIEKSSNLTEFTRLFPEIFYQRKEKA